VPELPEVETVARCLRPAIIGRTVTACRLRAPGLVRYPDPESFVAELPGHHFAGVGRRGKYLILPDPSGRWLVVHLGMTGQLSPASPLDPEPDHLHLILDLDDGGQLRYRDPRRFGRLLLGTEAELLTSGTMPALGPEPLDPTFRAADLARRLHGRTAPIKALLLDQGIVAGVGNIYADEALFRARVRPTRAAGSLSIDAVRRLRRAIGEIIAEAIERRGSTVRDYRDSLGREGQFQERLLVYGRAGEPCARCSRPLSLTRIAGRSTVFCRYCQR
jgi:formamidopyrimidine-DNA glycosylase